MDQIIGPQCRSAISLSTLFIRAAFEPGALESQFESIDVDDSSEDELPLPSRGKAVKRKGNKS